MLTKKRFRQWLNVAFLVIPLAASVAMWFIPRLTTGEKAAGQVAFVSALLAALPTLKRQAADAVNGSDLPEDEPVQPFPGPGAMPTDGPGEAK